MKICKATDCLSPVFGGGYCQRHQYLRADKKPRGEMEIFIEIWDERAGRDGKHRSEISGRELDEFAGTDLFVNLFAHILSKGLYGFFRLRKDNIFMVHPREHALIDRGTKQQREAYEKEQDCLFKIFYERRELLKQQYKKIKNN